MDRRFLTLLCVSIPSFMINLDANIVSVSLPSIAQTLHADFGAIEWVISAYTLAFASLVMPAGALADRFGRKRLLVVGLAVFTLASLICGAASSVTLLNWARAVQGTGAALQLSAALALLSNEFQGKHRAKAFAFWGSIIGIGIMLGPVAGGVITQILGWQWAFYVNLPIGAAMIALTVFTVTESRDPEANRIDVVGVVTLASFLGLATYALISGNHAGWSSQPVLTSAFCAAAALVAFIVVERIQERPMMDFTYFIRPTYLGANIAAVAYAATFLTMLTYLPFFFQNGLAFGPMKAGALMLPLAAALFVVPRLVTAYVEHRVSGRLLLVVGLILVGSGLLIASTQVGTMSYLRVAVPMMLASIGAGILNGQVVKVGMTVIPADRAGMASGVSGTMRFSGIVIGFAALGAVFFQGITSGVSHAIPFVGGDLLRVISRAIGSGDMTVAATLLEKQGIDGSVAREIVGAGLHEVMKYASMTAFVAAIASHWLISPAETEPLGTKETQVIDSLID
ncbi:MFS transporter [Paraburkholderia caribensis]|uniref:MFS transporter n=1 Tax=Paraburkholderia caribensis TaxID=75105 RepID=UPI001CAB7985|nr:MFS transporter [Paraburkholderia caribensis]CAG9248292.1 Drug resistance transporter EmrB/QacA subfamily [Paraburkholderia caribensis]